MLALMLPNLVLAFTEGYNGWSAVAGVVLPLGLYLLTTLLTRRVSLIGLAMLPVLGLCVVQVVLLYLYGGSIIAVDMFTNIMTTNSTESRELLRGLTPIIVLVLLLYLPLIYAIVRQSGSHRYRLTEKVRFRAAFTGAVLTIIGVQLIYPAERVADDNILRSELFPVNVLYNFRIALGNRIAAGRYHRTSAAFDYDAVRSEATSQREIYIYVIGESSRAANWSLYGYDRITTPRLAEREDICIFKSVTTQSNTTHKSVPLMLSSVDAAEYEEMFCRKGLAALFDEVGFRSCFISTQSPQGAMVDNFASECDTVIYMGTSGYDCRLVQEVRREVESSTDNLLFILHCYGSHYCYNQRYPADFALFQPADEVAVNARNIEVLRNSYDNTILYTDYLLDSIAEYLSSLDACAAMLYCSDHGEALYDDERGRFLHASTMVTYYHLHVPALIWFSEEYRALRPEKAAMAARHRWSPATTRAMFHTLADVAAIESRYVDSRRSLVSAEYNEQAPRLYLDDRNRAVRLDRRIGITDLDRRMFLLHGVKLE